MDNRLTVIKSWKGCDVIFVGDQDSVEQIQREMLKSGIELEGAWENVEEKSYTPEEFITAGDFYMARNDRIQAAEKYWLAAVYAVKHLFLDIGLLSCSHYANKALTYYLTNLAPEINIKPSIIAAGWPDAEDLHGFSYGNWLKRDFNDYLSRVKLFVDTVPKFKPIIKQNGLNGVFAAVNNKDICLKIKVNPGNVKLSGKKRTHTHTCI